mmetsp:Transcript_118203/g.294922  ORF Transcript_118203/g.294922 Transcript_118203/m.294922 type:complete len:434 (+) Transcript_118203:100-1401(+)
MSGAEQQAPEVIEHTESKLSRDWCMLLCTTLAHVLFNFGVGATISIPGIVLESLKHQVGHCSMFSSAILIAAAAGNIPGVILGGFALDRFPAHRVLFFAASLSALNLAIMPFARGIVAVAASNAAIYFGNGILDCSFSVLSWSVRDCGVADSRLYLSAKTIGTMLGCICATHIAAASDVGNNYDILAYTYSILCFVAGIVFLLLPSPHPPVAGAQDAQVAPSRWGAWRNGCVVLAGSFLLMVVLGCFCAATTLTSHLPTTIEDSILGVFYSTNIFTVLASVALARRLSTWKALVLLFLLAAASSCSMATAYMVGTEDEETTRWILRASYIGMSTVMASFPLCFAFIEALVRLSGTGTTLLAGGAALGPLLTAVVADFSPVTLWCVLASLLLGNAIGVAILHYACSSGHEDESMLHLAPEAKGSGKEKSSAEPV